MIKIKKTKKIWYLNVVTFLAAFLLFQIELIISKCLLNKFGGTYAVWGAALVFFQATLFLGYLYSHLVLKKFNIYRYRYFHLFLLFLTLLVLPYKHYSHLFYQINVFLVFNVFLQLLLSIGLVFFVLSTTSIVVQAFLAESELPEQSNPYALYGISNLGSFAGLLTYPLFFETYFNLDTQLNIWRIGYFFLLIFFIIAVKSIKLTNKKTQESQIIKPISFKEKVRWFSLSIAGVIMFLSVTNIVTYEITPMPLLWILPLCIYLISFVLTFKQKPWYPPWIYNKIHFTIALGVLFFCVTKQRNIPFMIALICHAVLLFVLCMFCQGELHKHKPSDSKNLTKFYLIISLGGFIGSLFVSWIAPLISGSMVEYLVGLFIISIALAIDSGKKEIGAYRIRLIIYMIIFVLLWPNVFKEYNFIALIILITIFTLVYDVFKVKPVSICVSIFSLLCLSPLIDLLWSKGYPFYQYRNYYGIYSIYDYKGRRNLMNGTTTHGAQYLNKKNENIALTYYHKYSAIGKLMTSEDYSFKRIGIVGLGTGTQAIYGKEDQTIDYFELDKDMYKIANEYFTYLKNSKSKINYIFGDARISLQKISDKYYDLLIIDAFSGDSVPVHLLTTEAITEYLRCTTDEGIVMLHISNKYITLTPVLFSNAEALNVYGCVNIPSRWKHRDFYPSEWFTLIKNKEQYEQLRSEFEWRNEEEAKITKNERTWSDSYSNIISIFKFGKMADQIKQFKIFYWDFNNLP